MTAPQGQLCLGLRPTGLGEGVALSDAALPVGQLVGDAASIPDRVKHDGVGTVGEFFCSAHVVLRWNERFNSGSYLVAKAAYIKEVLPETVGFILEYDEDDPRLPMTVTDGGRVMDTRVRIDGLDLACYKWNDLGKNKLLIVTSVKTWLHLGGGRYYCNGFDQMPSEECPYRIHVISGDRLPRLDTLEPVKILELPEIFNDRWGIPDIDPLSLDTYYPEDIKKAVDEATRIENEARTLAEDKRRELSAAAEARRRLL